MLHDLDRFGPELMLLVAAAALVLGDLLIRDRRWLPFGALSGLTAAAIWAVVLVLRDQQAPAFHGAIALDNFSVFFIFLFIGVSGLVVLASARYAQRFGGRQSEFFALLLVATAGMMLLASGRELITIFVALETTSLSQYILASFLKDSRSTEAGLKYLLLGAVATATVLYGMAFLFGLSGTTRLVAGPGEPSIAETIASGDSGLRPALILAMVFLAGGFAFKMAVVPFQMWAPDVYEGAPTPVAAFLSVGSKAAGFAVALRVFYEGFGPNSFVGSDWSNLFASLAAISMVVGNVIALRQTNMKRLLGYSSIAQAGNVAVGLAAIAASKDTALGASGVVFFLAAYAFTNLGAFFAVLAISERAGSDEIADYAGMSRRAPFLAAGLAFCLVSLTGIPPTAGFVAKIYIFNAAVQSDLVWLVIVAVINTAISAFYYLRVVSQMYLAPPPAGAPAPARGDWGLSVALAVTSIGVLVVGLVPSPIIHAAERAANVFL